MELKSEIRHFIVENFLYGQDDDFSDEVSFLERGLIDSTGVLEVVSFIEDKYGISVDDDEMIPENLDTVNCLANFVVKKRGE